jgi:glycosyltransferase involved in cell wall biosynthesis
VISDHARRVAFLYWGRRGLTQFALELAQAAAADPTVDATFSMSRQNDEFGRFAGLGDRLFAIDTFSSSAGAAFDVWRIPGLRRRFAAHIRERRIEAVIDLMPHVWSGAVATATKATGARYAVIAHDAETHQGDYRTKWVKAVIDRPLRQADVVLTMSEAVTRRLNATRRAPNAKIVTLFHPLLTFGAQTTPTPPAAGAPFRLLFLGRIMAYKGLPLFLDAVELLRSDGYEIDVGVFGDGPLGTSATRLEKMGAEVVNRWLTDAEIAAILPRFHAVVLSHTEASQSGVAASAHGAGLPVIATPVGGLVEQVRDGETGVIAKRVDARAIADATIALISDAAFYARVCDAINASRTERSMSRFLRLCVASAFSV